MLGTHGSVILPPDPDAGTPSTYTLYARDWWHDDQQGRAHGLPEGYHNPWGMPCVAEPCFAGWPCRSCYRAVRRLVGTSRGFPKTPDQWGCASEDLDNYDCNWTMALRPDAVDAAAYPVQNFNATTMSSPGKASQFPLDFYGVTLFSPPGAFRVIFMFGMRLWHYSSDCRSSDFRVNDGTCDPATTDVTLSVSRDGGRSFHYVSREAVLSPGISGSWSSKRVWVLPTPYQEGATQTVAYAAYNVDENARIDGPVQVSGLAASRGRLDGMSALATTGFGQVGEALTMPLRFTGSSLELNVDCGGHGWVTVEIADEAGSPLPGFALADSVPTMINSVRARAVWKAGSSVAALAGKAVRLRFSMKDAKLFSFRFVSVPRIKTDDSSTGWKSDDTDTSTVIRLLDPTRSKLVTAQVCLPRTDSRKRVPVLVWGKGYIANVSDYAYLCQLDFAVARVVRYTTLWPFPPTQSDKEARDLAADQRFLASALLLQSSHNASSPLYGRLSGLSLMGGHSMGAYTAAVAAQDAQVQVAGLALFAPGW